MLALCDVCIDRLQVGDAREPGRKLMPCDACGVGGLWLSVATLPVWVIYDHPSDYPHAFVVRRRDVCAGLAARGSRAHESPIRRRSRHRGELAMTMSPNEEVLSLDSRSGVLALCEVMMDMARGCFAKFGESPMTAHIITRYLQDAHGAFRPQGEHEPPAVISVFPWSVRPITGDVRADFSHTVCHIIRGARAIGVLFLAEMWTLEPTSPEEAAKILADGGPIEGRHDAREAVFVSLEHPTGNAYWQAWIDHPADRERPVLGPFEPLPALTEGQGRFFDFMTKATAS